MEKERYQYIDILNVLACLAVIFHHSSGAYWSFEKAKWWIGASFFQAITYFCVPMFFMICGITLIDYRKKYNTKEYFINRFKKTFIPFIIWNVLALFVLYLKGNIGIYDFNPIIFINNIFNYRIVIFYWYFIALYTAYLCIPVLSLIPEKKRLRVYLYIFILFFVLNVFLPLFFKLFLKDMTWNNQLNMPLGSSYVFYLLIGYYIDRANINKKIRYIIYILGIFGFLLLFFGTLKLSFRDNAINETFKGYAGFCCILYSISLLTFFKNELSSKVKNTLFKISKIFRKQTFGIYLVHWFVLELFVYLFNPNMKSNKIIIILGFIMFFVSWIIVYIMQKIPLIKKIVP